MRDTTAAHTSIEHRVISRPGLHAHRVIGDAQFLPDDLAQHGVKAGAGIAQGRIESHRPIRRDHHFGYRGASPYVPFVNSHATPDLLPGMTGFG